MRGSALNDDIAGREKDFVIVEDERRGARQQADNVERRGAVHDQIRPIRHEAIGRVKLRERPRDGGAQLIVGHARRMRFDDEPAHRHSARRRRQHDRIGSSVRAVERIERHRQTLTPNLEQTRKMHRGWRVDQHAGAARAISGHDSPQSLFDAFACHRCLDPGNRRP
ncbi:hypothetical protein CVO77_14630 [Sphingopyxis lindanitolerans]|uniref:Uncharacterized protein n=1 Tax=Sphingopyxis lindanitolerans TaxID=2054227 RepID=A0A2S8B1S3_9SPHN|nr:hypothetical protein CVO77_14630 [Sphingopyxis lindanitolerans]